MHRNYKFIIYCTGLVNVCQQHVKTSGAEGTITGSFTADQLRTGDYECTLPFNDVSPNSVFELYANSYSHPYNCQCGFCYYFVIRGFTSGLGGCLLYTRRVYRYRRANGSISIIPRIRDIAPLLFNLTYNGKSAFSHVY